MLDQQQVFFSLKTGNVNREAQTIGPQFPEV